MKKQSSQFLSKLSRKIRKRQQRMLVRKRHQADCHFQPLEPRKLLSADGLMSLAASAPRVVDSGVIQVQERVREVDATWFEDLAPQVSANVDATVSSLNWKGTNITTISDQWIIQLNNKALGEVRSVGDTFDLLNLGEYDGQVVRGLGMAGLILVQTQTEMDADTFMDTIYDSGWVDYIQPNAVLENQSTTPNDTSFLNTWGLHNTGQFTGSVADADIDAPEAWDLSTGSANVVVGVIDTGVKYNHVDLINNMWTNPGEIAGNGIDDDGNGFIDDFYGYDFVNNDSDPMDDHGHGTHVAGTVAADGNNGKGVAGVSWNSQIMALKFMSSTGSGSTSDAVRAINYATMMKQTYGVNILITCNSWGGGGYSTSLYNAIVANKDAGMLFMAAAGNDSTNNDSSPHYPSNYDVANVISVASTDWADNLSSFSNYGATTVDIAAPGSYIYSTTYDGGYGYKSGTSMATPQVAGLAALAWSYSPDATWQEIKAAILNNGDTLASLSGKVSTGKRINAFKTLSALTPPEPEPDIRVTASALGGVISDGSSTALNLGNYYVGDTATSYTFTIDNIGTENLTVSNFSIPTGFTLVQNASATITAGNSTSFILKANTASSGMYMGTVSFSTNDPDIATFDFKVAAIVSTPTPAEVSVTSQSNVDITDGSSTADNFGNKLLNATAQRTYTISNSGQQTLTLGSLVVTGDFSVITDLPASLAGGASTTFVLAMDTTTLGAKNGTVSFTSNDSDESPFNFLLDGSVVEQPDPQEVQVTYSGGEILDGQVAGIDFGDVDYGDNMPEITFTVTNTGDKKLTTSGLTAGSGFSIVEGLDSIINAGESDTFTIRMITSAAGSKSATISFNSNDEDEGTFNFTAIGSVAAPANGIDLSVDWAEDADEYIVPGKKSKVLVDVTNNGTIAMSDSVTINVYGNTSNTLDGDEVLLGTVTKTLTLKPDQSKSNRVVIELDSTIPADDYYLFAVVDPDNTITESNENNNTAVTTSTSQIAWKFGDLGDGKKTTLKLEDSDGSLVQFSLTGNGVGEVIENADGSWSVYITGTNNATKVAISGKGGDGRVELQDLIIGDTNDANDKTVIGQLAGKNVDINGGEFIVTGTIQKLVLGDITDATMTFGDSFSRGTDVTLEQLSDVTINAETGFSKFTIVDWTDNDSTADEFNAFWVNKLTAKGSKKLNINGDFETDMTLSGTGAGSYAIDTMVVKGAMDGRSIDITGNVKLMKIDSAEDTDINVTGDIEKLILGHMLNGSLTANSIDKLSTSGASNIPGSTGDFTADMTINGSKSASYSLKTVSIKGDLSDADWEVAGKIGSLVAKGDTDSFTLSVVDDSDLRLDAALDKLVLANVNDTDITVEGNIDLVKATNWTGGSVSAEAITVVKVDGTMTGDINLLGNEARGEVLKAMTVKGNVTNVDWDMVGEVGKVQLNGTTTGLDLNIVDGESRGQEASIEKLVLADVASGDVTVEGEIEYVRADSWNSGSITAEDILKSSLPE
jgi:subtilisin family serine protease